MKFCILTEGGNEFGFGHLVRCTSFYDGILERGHEVEFIVKGDKSIQSVLLERKFEFLDWHGKVRMLINTLNKYDVVILDTFHIVQKELDLLCQQSFTLVSIDDYLRNSYHDSIIIDWTLNVEKSDIHKKDLFSGNIVLQGIDNVVLRKPFRRISKRRFSKLQNVLLTLGGNDIRGLTLPVITHLSMQFNDLIFHVIIGINNGTKEEIAKLNLCNVKIYENLKPNEMKTLMDNCDVAISAGGQTLYELASVGIPTISIKIADNQNEDIEGWKSFGLIFKVVAWNDETMLSQISVALKELYSAEIRKKISSKVINVIKGDNLERIIELIENKIYAKNRK
jgi:UDP-2,4-diacetamido-2,4,6-trideoxy-beta-L-altropyranose hydrolase